MECKRCRSFAINPHCHGRKKGMHEDLCDVCYWRKIAEDALSLLEEIAENADEDCPIECRSKHLSKAILDAGSFCDEFRNYEVKKA